MTNRRTYADKPFDLSTATLLADGRVLLTGCGGIRCDVGVTELYDPGTDTFSRTGPMSEWYSANTATVLVNGKVLFVGTSEDNAPSEAEVYDPATGTFAGVGDTIWPHDFATATLVPDGKVLFTGARLPGGAITGGAELYDPVQGTFAYAGSMATFPNNATLLNDGRVLITGRGPSLSQTSSAARGNAVTGCGKYPMVDGFCRRIGILPWYAAIPGQWETELELRAGSADTVGFAFVIEPVASSSDGTKQRLILESNAQRFIAESVTHTIWSTVGSPVGIICSSSRSNRRESVLLIFRAHRCAATVVAGLSAQSRALR